MIIVVHLYGYVADMPAIAKLAGERGILVGEDACQAIGADIGGVKAGNFADFGIFSFHSHKKPDHAGRRRHDHGQGRPPRGDRPDAAAQRALRLSGRRRPDYWKPAMGNVDFPELDGERLWPNNYCLGEVECALGAKQLDRVPEINAEKRKTGAGLYRRPGRVTGTGCFHRVDSTRHNYHLLAARMDGVERRDDFIRRMFHEHGVKCVVQYCPLNRVIPCTQKLGFGQSDCPNGDEFFDHTLPPAQPYGYGRFEHMLTAAKTVLDRQRSGK